MLRQGLDFAVYVFVRVLIALVQAVPLSICERGAEVLATLASRLLRLRQNVVDENLRIAFPQYTEAERSEICWRMWRQCGSRRGGQRPGGLTRSARLDHHWLGGISLLCTDGQR